MLLLKKKKYASVKVIKYIPAKDGEEEKEEVEIEKKGIDLVRRDWCVLSKEVGEKVLNYILSGDAIDEVVGKITSLLHDLSEDMRNGKINIDKYVITKGLNKGVENYGDIKGQAHLKVARDMINEGKVVNVFIYICLFYKQTGDHIEYIFCKGEDKSPAERAFSPHDIERSNGKLEVDVEFYLDNQILPPISRLCEAIEGVSVTEIAEILGLDGNKYKRNDIDNSNAEYNVAECQKNESDRFVNCNPFIVKCPNCASTFSFPGRSYYLKEQKYIEDGYKCLNCDFVISYECYYNQLMLFISNEINLYYEGWLKCDNCGHRTKYQSVIGCKCNEHGCVGNLYPEMSDKMLYNELLYLKWLFKNENEKKNNKTNSDGNRMINVLIENYLNKSGYDYVDCSSLFKF